MELKEALTLTYGDILEHKHLCNVDKSAMRFRVSGKVITWKRNKDRIKIPIKHGLYDYGYLVNNTFEGGQFNIDISEVEKA